MDPVPRLGGLFVQRSHAAAKAGVVNQNIDAAKSGFGSRDHAAHLILVGNVGVDTDSAATDCRCDIILPAADVGADDAGPLGGKQFCHRLAHA